MFEICFFLDARGVGRSPRFSSSRNKLQMCFFFSESGFSQSLTSDLIVPPTKWSFRIEQWFEHHTVSSGESEITEELERESSIGTLLIYSFSWSERPQLPTQLKLTHNKSLFELSFISLSGGTYIRLELANFKLYYRYQWSFDKGTTNLSLLIVIRRSNEPLSFCQFWRRKG